MTQKELAVKIGVGHRTVCRWEQSKEPIAIRSLGKLEEVLRLDEPPGEEDPTLGKATFAELIAELSRRHAHLEEKIGRNRADPH